MFMKIEEKKLNLTHFLKIKIINRKNKVYYCVCIITSRIS